MSSVQPATANTKKLVPWLAYLISLAVLNETVFNVATPKIAEQFSLSPAGVSWMMTIFMIFFGIGSVIYGKLSDIYSLKTLILIGTIIYVVGSVIGFVFQTSYPIVVTARGIQGIGASAIPALIFVAIARYFPANERGRIFGLITATVSFSIGLGPVIGGFVAGKLHWSLLFIIPLFTLIAIPFLRRYLPDEERRSGTVDALGASLVALSIGALVVYLTLDAWYYLALFVLLVIATAARVKLAADPFIDPTLFKNRLFRNGVVVGFLLFSMVIGILFVIPLMLHDVHNLNPSQIGLILFPGAISSVIFGPLGGRLADARGNSFVVSIGLSLLVASLVIISLVVSISAWLVSAALLLLYIGFALFQTALVNSVSQTLPVNEVGVGMGIFNLVSIISGAMGTAIVGKILATKLLAFNVFSIPSAPKAFEYSNLMAVFAVIVVVGGIVYLRSYRNLHSAA